MVAYPLIRDVPRLLVCLLIRSNVWTEIIKPVPVTQKSDGHRSVEHEGETELRIRLGPLKLWPG